MHDIDLIGVPTDIGAGARGASMGPEALRVAGIANGYRHLPEVRQRNENLHHAVWHSLRRGHLPIVLGGDHCLGLGSISAVARHCREQGKTLRVLWLDAHADFNTHTLTPSGNLHGMPVALLCGMGPPELTGIGGHTHAINPDVVRQIGIRSVDPGE